MEIEELIKRVMQNIAKAIECTPKTSNPLLAIENSGAKLDYLDLESVYGVCVGSYIFIANDCPQDKINEVAWHELGHYLMHIHESKEVAEIEANLYSFIMNQIMKGVQLWNI